MEPTRRPWSSRALIVASTVLTVVAGLAVTAPARPAAASAPNSASTPATTAATAATASATDDGLGPFGSLAGDPMNGYRLYEMPNPLALDFASINALGPHGEIAGLSADGSNGNLYTPFVFTPGEGTQWLDPVPGSVNRVGGFDARGNLYGTAGNEALTETVVYKWTREDYGYAAPQAIFHGDTIRSDWSGSVTAVNAAGDVLLGDGAALLHEGQATLLSPLPGTDGSYPAAGDLNDKGQAVGFSEWPQGSAKGFEPTLWTPAGSPSSLGFPPLVYENATASAINNKGQVIVGNPSSDQDPWLREPDGGFKLLAVPKDAPAGAVQRVHDLGEDGTAVGDYQPGNDAAPYASYAAIWTRDGQRVQLMDHLVTGGAEIREWHLATALAVNGEGIIAGVGTHHGRRVAWIAVPVDPVVFVHGAGASSLDTLDSDGAALNNAWMDCSQGRMKMSLWPQDQADGKTLDLHATDALRRETCFGIGPGVNPALDIYGSLLDRLRGNYQEYDRKHRPALQTEAGCDTGQMGELTPNLFVYAYDWRKDNRENADGLAEYLRCVHKFWPGSKVDIVTHSMGSLVARRYLLEHGGDDVDRMITIGAPWLGAPKLVNVLQTGDFAPQPVNGDRDVIKHVVGSFPAAHQLAASRLYGDAAKLPIVQEEGWDLNGRGGAWQRYSYDDVKDLLDAQNPTFKPGTTGDTFQNENGAVGGQTDWRNDTSGVAYTHIVGLQAGANTIGTVVAERSLACSGVLVKTCEHVDHIRQLLVCGDGTVPYVSAERAGKGVDYNAPDAEVLIARASSTEDNQGVEHTGLASNPSVQDDILRRLFSPMVDTDHDGHRDPVPHDRSGLGQPGDDLDSCYQPTAPTGASLAASPAYGASDPAPGTGLRYLSVVGGTGLTVADSTGHSTDPQGATAGYVAGVTLYPSDRPDAGMVTFPESDTEGFTTSFAGTGKPVQLELLDGSQSSPTRALRWADVPVADGQAARLRATADGREVLEVDQDGDGTPETAVAPTVKVGGSDATDTSAPEITATRLATPDGVRFGLAATDAGSGVAELRWSSDGTHFQRYDAPVAADPGTHLTAFATDRAGNRSAPYELDVDAIEPGLFTTATVSPAPSAEGWTAGTATVKLEAQAPAGGAVAGITYRTSGAAGAHEETVAGDVAELEVKTVGTTTVSYAATSADGTEEPERTTQVRIDQAAPTATIKQPTPTAIVSSLPAIKGTASDDASGVTGVELELRNSAGKYWDGEAWTDQPSWLGASGTTTWSRSTGLPQGADLASGAYRLRVRASDGAGHSAVVADAGFTVSPTVALGVRRLTVSSSQATSGIAVNEQGVAVGVTTADDGTHVVRWTNGRVEVLPMTGSAARVNAVDESGAAYGSQDVGQQTQPVRWGNGSEGLKTLPTVADGGNGEVEDATGDGSVMVGWSSLAGQPKLPVRWVHGQVEQLPLTPGATAGEAKGVAADGTVVGRLTTPSGTRAVLWTADGGVRNLGTLPDHVSSAATGINDLGEVIGTSTDANGSVSGFTYADGQMTPLNKSFTTPRLIPNAIDNAGTVVGEYQPWTGGDNRAFVTGEDGRAEDLTARLPAGSGWQLVRANGVNELGQVVGFGTGNGKGDGFLVGPAHAPITEDQAVSTPKDTAVPVDLAGFDPDVADPVTYEVVDGPSRGSLGPIVDGRLTYTPDAGYQGVDRFTWRMSDPDYGSVPATVTVTVGEVKPDPGPDPQPDNPPTIAVTAPAAGDEGGTVALHATAADPEGADLAITWSVTGGVVTGSGNDVTLTLPDGPDAVTVTASTTDGTHPVTATAAIDVRNLPPTAAAGGDVSVDQGTPLTLTGVAADPSAEDAARLTTSWDFGDGTTASGTTVNHTWSAAGVFQVTFSVSDPDGARATDTVQVTVNKRRTPASVFGVVKVSEGVATLAASTDGTTSRGTVSWVGKGGPFVARVTGVDRITTSTGKRAAWIDGTYGRHTIRVYVESGLWLGHGDALKLWVDGTLITSTGGRSLGLVVIC